jgi:hypothetical protein
MEKIWFNDVSGFITPQNWYIFFPSVDMTLSEQLNSLMRLSIIFAVVIFIFKKDANILFVPIFMGLFTFLMYTVDSKNKQSDKMLLDKLGMMEEYTSKELCVKPSKNNPFMNVLASDYGDNPTRPRACRIVGRVKKDIKKNFDVNLYRDVDDVFHKKASDRQFYTTPSTTIPNDSVGYANWLYGGDKSCKEGNGPKCLKNMYRSHNV